MSCEFKRCFPNSRRESDFKIKRRIFSCSWSESLSQLSRKFKVDLFLFGSDGERRIYLKISDR
ncbi:hypothetical protein DLM78_00920 [Leptospira stimsonii]|uniref:Uncharacterized protein n=1 Tax=Leptospira stimsonii TaxID=2202203 RepID=A0A8B3CU83_9LEPT|nr:hypothetical protein DLM78_00920 [Leptospira stimsonii]